MPQRESSPSLLPKEKAPASGAFFVFPTLGTFQLIFSNIWKKVSKYWKLFAAKKPTC